MNRLLISIFMMIAICPFAIAQNSGFVRVTIVDKNPEHTWPVNLSINGQPAGSFSHKEGITYLALSPALLNAKGSSTSFSAKYDPNIAAKGCRFDFIVQFSFSADFNRPVPLGQFRAPSVAVNGTIPIGLMCGGVLGEVCSSDTSIQKQITQSRMQKRVDEFNQYKRRYDKTMRDRKARYIEKQSLSTQPDNLAKKVDEDYDWSYTDELPPPEPEITPEVKADEADRLEKGEPTVDAVVAATLSQERQFDVNMRLNLAHDLYNTPFGAPYAAVIELDALWQLILEEMAMGISNTPESIAADKAHDEEEMRKFRNLQSDVVRDGLWFQRYFIQGRFIKDAAVWAAKEAADPVKLIGDFSLGDGLDLCEVVTQTKDCTPGGGKMSFKDTVFRTVGLLFKGLPVDAILKVGGIKGAIEDMQKDSNDLEQTRAKMRYVKVEFVDDESRPEGSAPYNKDSLVLTFETIQSEQFVSLSGPDGRADRWLIRPKKIEGLSPQAIREKFRLPFLPTQVRDVTMPAYESIRRGVVGDGAVIYEAALAPEAGYYGPARTIER